MNKTKIIVKLEHFCEVNPSLSEFIGRITGLINAENFVKLMSRLDIESNPRKPKESSVTKEIFETLQQNPSYFHLMSKGILLSSSSCEKMERSRFKLDFEHNGFAQPGILDGGHNTFAIAKFILSHVLDESEIKKIKDWEVLIDSWKTNNEELSSLFKDDEGVDFKFHIPIEIIFPRNNNTETLEAWGDNHRDITHARNNNTQLTDSTKDNHQGFYKYIKELLPATVKDKIEWKTNDGGQIKVADITALALIPLSKLPKSMLPVEISPVKLYNSKQFCVETFRSILEMKGDDGNLLNGIRSGQMFDLSNTVIMSGLDLVKDLVDLYDYIYKEFPSAYNEAGGSFGKIDGVRIYDPKHLTDKKYSKRPFYTKFFGRQITYQYADGFIVPLVVGLSELINCDGKIIYWVTDPKEFLQENLKSILKIYSTVIKFSNWDPQKVGKDNGSYELAAGAMRMAISEHKFRNK